MDLFDEIIDFANLVGSSETLNSSDRIKQFLHLLNNSYHKITTFEIRLRRYGKLDAEDQQVLDDFRDAFTGTSIATTLLKPMWDMDTKFDEKAIMNFYANFVDNINKVWSMREKLREIIFSDIDYNTNDLEDG